MCLIDGWMLVTKVEFMIGCIRLLLPIFFIYFKSFWKYFSQKMSSILYINQECNCRSISWDNSFLDFWWIFCIFLYFFNKWISAGTKSLSDLNLDIFDNNDIDLYDVTSSSCFQVLEACSLQPLFRDLENTIYGMPILFILNRAFRGSYYCLLHTFVFIF